MDYDVIKNHEKRIQYQVQESVVLFCSMYLELRK